MGLLLSRDSYELFEQAENNIETNNIVDSLNKVDLHMIKFSKLIFQLKPKLTNSI